MAISNFDGEKEQGSAPQCTIGTAVNSVAPAESFSPPAGWAESNPDLALKLLYICPQQAPWVDEILDSFQR